MRDAIREKKLATVEEVAKCTRAATGCSSCYDDIQAILDDSAGRKPKAAAPSAYATTYRQVLDVIGALNAGDVKIELVDVDGDRVLAYVRAPGGDTSTPERLALKRRFVDAMSASCGRRMQLIELNQVEAWKKR